MIKTTASTPKVSVIIPVYNCEEYLQRCLDSIYAQTFQDFDIVAVNDGSTDGCLEILNHNAKKHSNLTVIDQKNKGQGYIRNHQLDKAKGEYVLFVDADDYIESLTLELAVAKAEKDNSDVVHFDSKLSSLIPERPNTFMYVNAEPFAHKRILEGPECDELLGANTFYSVSNLYRRSFLNKNHIRYDEGHIYEDVIFMVQVANRANKISIVHAPLYIVQRNLTSTTRSHTKTDKHYKDYIRAVRRSFEFLNPRTEHSTFYLGGYFLNSFIAYYNKRVPVRLRGKFIKEFVDIFSGVDMSPADGGPRRRLLQVLLNNKIFVNKKYSTFHLFVVSLVSVLPHRSKIAKIKSLRHRVGGKSQADYKRHLNKPIIEDQIVFLGFDFRYTGNSRYLFEEMINDSRYKDKDIKFLTDDSRVDDKYRVTPDTVEARRLLGRAGMIIAESWVPGRIKKRFSDAIWLQLWHGVPLKRVLFDSHEPEIMSRYNKHKIHKYQDVLRWDYLLTDSEAEADKFSSAFLFPKDRMIQAGYPRVKYLKENIGSAATKTEIKKTIGLDQGFLKKKIVLYAPTWRDYNYAKKPEDSDYNYVLDINKLAKKLGDDYLILFHDHGYLASQIGDLSSQCIDASRHDIQELMLISDYLVSDFSSIIFDAFPANIPVIIYASDVDRYQASRGVYEDIWADLDDFKASSVDKVTDLIKNYKISDSYRYFNKKYCYSPKANLLDFIADIDVEKMNRDW